MGGREGEGGEDMGLYSHSFAIFSFSLSIFLFF